MRIVLCHGTFDPVHVGHMRMFEEAKKLGDHLVVTLTADIYVNKGPGRPILSQSERAYSLSRLKGIDTVEICLDRTALPMIEKWRPDFYVKGVDYKTEDRNGALVLEKAAVERNGGKLVILESPKYSASLLIDRIHASYGRR